MRVVSCLPTAALMASTFVGPAWSGRMEHRISMRGRELPAIAASDKHKRFFPKDAAEVVVHLEAIGGALRKWYVGLGKTARASRDFRFPASTPWSPGKFPCPPGAPLLSPEDIAWRHPSWQVLGFRPARSHRFQYRVVAVGVGAEASFSVQARADRDCNGRKALYRLSGHARSGALRFPLLRVRHANE